MTAQSNWGCLTDGNTSPCPKLASRERIRGPWTEATLSLVITKGQRASHGGLTGGVDEFQTQASGPRHSPAEPDAGQEPEPSFHDVVFKGHAPPWAHLWLSNLCLGASLLLESPPPHPQLGALVHLSSMRLITSII